MTVVRLDPDENGATSNWTKEGARPNWEEVAQAAMQANKKLKDGSTEEEAQVEKKPSEAEGKARGVKSSTPSQVQQVKVSAAQVEAKIPAGATIKRIVFRWFGKPGSVLDKDQLEFGALTEPMAIGGSAEVFHLGTVSKANTEATTRASLIEKLQFQYTKNPEGGAESRVNVVYIEVEYEAGGESFSGTASLPTGVRMTATGAKASTGTAAVPVGDRLTATGAKSVTGSAAIPAGAKLTATGAKLATGTAALQAGARQTAAGTKTASGVATIRSAALLAATGAKTTIGEARLTAACRELATGAKSTAADAIISVAVKLNATAGPKTVTGVAALHVGGAIRTVGSKLASGLASLRAAVHLGAGRETPLAPPVIYAAARDELLTYSGAADMPLIASGSSDELLTYSGARDT